MKNYRIIELNGFPPPHIRIRQQRATATDMDTAKRVAETTIHAPANPDCWGVLIVGEDEDGRSNPLLTVIPLYKEDGFGRLDFIGFAYDDDPVRCRQNYGLGGEDYRD